jgi:hypothetical protein
MMNTQERKEEREAAEHKAAWWAREADMARDPKYGYDSEAERKADIRVCQKNAAKFAAIAQSLS